MNLADVLAAHQWSPAKPFVGRGGCIGCAFHGSYEAFVTHQVAAVAAAGLVVSPAPTRPLSYQHIADHVGGE